MGLNKALAFSCISLMLACAGAAKADTFSTGQFITYVQADWGSTGVAAPLLTVDYNSVYASTTDTLIVGVVGTTGQFNVAFTSVGSVLAYLPAVGSAGTLTASLTNPATTPSNVFGGDVVALELDVDFNNAGFLQGTSSVPFGDLVLTNFTGSLSGLNGVTVNQFLATVNTCLASGPCPYGVGNVDTVTAELTASFAGGETVSTFADTNLALPSSGTPAPEPSSLLLLAPAFASLAFLRRRRILRE